MRQFTTAARPGSFGPRKGIPGQNYIMREIHRGLSMLVRGCLIDIHRDQARKVATVRVARVTAVMTPQDQIEVFKAADVLAERARRFLGVKWTVVGWAPPPPLLNG